MRSIWATTDLVHLAKVRWRIERDYQELKDEIGIDHYEGRGRVGFHHHGALCIAASPTAVTLNDLAVSDRP